MSTLETGGYEVRSIFQLIGDKENDITKSIAWALNKCPVFMKLIISVVTGVDADPNCVAITYQKCESDKVITDLEITDGKEFYIIIEAKRGWILPRSSQLTMYLERTDYKKSPAKKKMIVSMSECSTHYADVNLPFKYMKYFCPVGGNGWPKEPPNYIEFRYYGKLQSIHHMEDF